MSLTAEQEAALRENTTTGDPFDVHSASVAAWRNVWELVDEARETATSGAPAFQDAYAGACTERDEARAQVSAREETIAQLREALRVTNALMVRPAHIFSCGAYDKFSIGGVCGECTCGVDAAAKHNEKLLSPSALAVAQEVKP